MIAVVIAVLFGGSKITGLARSLGRFGGEFKKGQLEIEKELQGVKDEIAAQGTKKEDEANA